MSGQVTFDARLTAFERQEMSRHYRQTYHMCYGGLENMDRLIFRVPLASVQRTEPPAVFLRELAAAAMSGEPVRVPRLSKSDQVRVSELLRQSSDRSAREELRPSDHTVTEAMTMLWRSWDDVHRVPLDALDRAEHVNYRGKTGPPARAAEPRGVVG